MAIVIISEAEATADFAALLKRVRAGDDIAIEGVGSVVQLHAESKPRLLSEVIAALRKREAERGEPLRMGKEFADDLEQIMNSREPMPPLAWD